MFEGGPKLKKVVSMMFVKKAMTKIEKETKKK